MAGAENPYIFILTSNYFLFSAVSEGDTINLQGFSVTSSDSSGTYIDFDNYINQQTGQTVVATGYVSGGNIYLGRNNAGYCNIIILRNRFNDAPTTGGTERTLVYFGGSLANEQAMATVLDAAGTTQTNCGLINMSRQTQFVLRVVTRDMDSASNIRPDNV